MSARGWFTLFASLLTLVGLGLATLFVIQNSSRTTQLSFDLGFAAWQLQNPVSVIELVGGAFAFGFLLAAVLFGSRALANGRRARKLEQEMALSASLNTGSSYGGGSYGTAGAAGDKAATGDRTEWK